MKKLVLFFMIVSVIAYSVFGSGQSPSAGEKVYTIKITHYNSPGEPNDISVHEWKRLVEEKSKGRVQFEVYPASQLGSQKDVMEQIRLGSNIISISDAGFLMDYVPDIGILYAPYLTDSYEAYFNLIESDWFKNISSEVTNGGFEIITAKWVYGTRHLLADSPVHVPSDLNGLKIRTPNMKLLVDTINAMGGVSTPMPLSEVYPAITQGVINGAENPISVLYGAKLQEQAKYLSLTQHVFNVSIWIGSATHFASLPSDVVSLIKTTGDEASLFQYAQSKKGDEAYLKKMTDEGVKVINPDLKAFKASVQKVYTNNFSSKLVQKIRAILSQ